MWVEALVDYIKHDGERVAPGTVFDVSAKAAALMLARGEVKRSSANSKGKKTASKAGSKGADD